MFGESDEDEDLLPVRAPQQNLEEEDDGDALIDATVVAQTSPVHQQEPEDVVSFNSCSVFSIQSILVSHTGSTAGRFR